MKTTGKIIVAAFIGAVVGYAIGSYDKRTTALSDLSVAELNDKLKNLIRIEDYEIACIVRDIINDKTKQNVR